jgi:hypothetical protein
MARCKQTPEHRAYCQRLLLHCRQQPRHQFPKQYGCGGGSAGTSGTTTTRSSGGSGGGCVALSLCCFSCLGVTQVTLE